jgi:EAL domain-containing protein (putative c-di-GMP-specific phosphodiesterase class I)/putative methionine-R-sulfoxide reductase with GAF domain
MRSSSDSSRSLQSLLNVQEALLQDLDPAHVMERLCAETLALLPAATGASVALVAPDNELRYACAVGTSSHTKGQRAHDAGNLARLALMAGQTMRSDDTRTDPRVDRDAYTDMGAGSVLVVPLLRDGQPFGAFEVIARRPYSFTDEDVTILNHVFSFVSVVISSAEDVFAVAAKTLTSVDHAMDGDILASVPRTIGLTDFVANSLGLKSLEYRHTAEVRERIQKLLARGGPDTVVQPIFDLRKHSVVGFEALARFTGSDIPTHMWFEEASASGLALDLEASSVRAALKTLAELPDDTYLSVNLSPEGATSGQIVDLLGDAPAERLVIEVTEHAVVQDYDALIDALKDARDRGTRIAVDDAGAGYASMRHILRLKPECIKLDIGITSGIDKDPVRRALASSLISFADEIGATIVAEGIESASEVNTLRDLGIGYGQGFFLGRPTPPQRTVGVTGLRRKASVPGSSATTVTPAAS